ncbi:MAG: DUF4170 domain-containing protein [Alphaproteobacteria bacterium]|nr:DUF4170 domain-containing protein [Alphaproteobacteria bacterium]
MAEQLLHLVLGGKVTDPNSVEFVDTEAVDMVGVYPNYASALEAWRGAAQSTVDDAETRYFIVHLHRMLDPDQA